MPVTRVFDFANLIKKHIAESLNKPLWFVKHIRIIYSSKFKNIVKDGKHIGYKVLPLEALVLTADKNITRLSYDELSKLVYGYLPYIAVYFGKKGNRGIYDNDFTCLSIDCSRVLEYAETKYYYHETKQVPTKPYYTELNESVLEKVAERFEHTKVDYETIMNEWLDKEHEADIDSINYGYGKVEGGYKD